MVVATICCGYEIELWVSEKNDEKTSKKFLTSEEKRDILCKLSPERDGSEVRLKQCRASPGCGEQLRAKRHRAPEKPLVFWERGATEWKSEVRR